MAAPSHGPPNSRCLKWDEFRDEGVHGYLADAEGGGQPVVAVDDVITSVEAVQIHEWERLAAFHGALDTREPLVVFATAGAAVRPEITAELVCTADAADDVRHVDRLSARQPRRQRTRLARSIGERRRSIGTTPQDLSNRRK
jgi:hypothetical protein